MAIFLNVAVYSGEISSQTNKEAKNVATIKFDSVTKGSVVFIKDHWGYVLYTEKIRKDGDYSKSFDLTQLPDSEYYFELEKLNEIRVIPFKVSKNKTEILWNDEYSICIPEIAVKGKYVYITGLKNRNQPWEINTLYNGDNLAYSEKLQDAKTDKRIYDFTTSLSGNYTILIQGSDRTFVHHIRIL